MCPTKTEIIYEKNVEKNIEKKTPPGQPWVFTKNFSPFGPAVWPALGNTYKNVLFYYIDNHNSDIIILIMITWFLYNNNNIYIKTAWFRIEQFTYILKCKKCIKFSGFAERFTFPRIQHQFPQFHQGQTAQTVLIKKLQNFPTLYYLKQTLWGLNLEEILEKFVRFKEQSW